MDFKTKDTLDNLKENTIGFRFRFLHRDSKDEYELKIDGTGVSSIDVRNDYRASLEAVISFIEDGIWKVIKTSSEHQHADVIRAYADGAKIQWRQNDDDFWKDVGSPSFERNLEYRIKPEMKKLFKVLFLFDGHYNESESYYESIEVFNLKNQNHIFTPIGINPTKFIEVDIDTPDIQ